MLTQYQYSC